MTQIEWCNSLVYEADYRRMITQARQSLDILMKVLCILHQKISLILNY